MVMMMIMMMVLALAIILIVVTTATVIILLRLRLSCCYNYYYCCSWQHVRLPPRGVCRFLCWHVLKLEFWHFARPKLNLGFVFASVFVVFSSKKMPQPAGCTVQKHAQLSISHRFFRCFPVVSHFASVFAVFWPSLDFLHMPASTFICLSTLCGGLGGGMGRGGGGDDVHAAAICVFFFFC